jgi:hypothetical protein
MDGTNYRGIALLQTTYKTLCSILVSLGLGRGANCYEMLHRISELKDSC